MSRLCGVAWCVTGVTRIRTGSGLVSVAGSSRALRTGCFTRIWWGSTSGRAGITVANQYLRDYDPQQITTAMMAVIATGGYEQARRHIKDHLGWKRVPSVDALRNWTTKGFVDEYQRLVEEYRPKMDEAAADQARKLVQMAGEAEQRVTEHLVERLLSADGEADDRIEETLDKLLDGKIERDTALKRIVAASRRRVDAKDAALILKNLTLSKGINIDKTAFIEGRPTQIVQHVSADEVLASLREQGRVIPRPDDVPADAVEVAPAGLPQSSA